MIKRFYPIKLKFEADAEYSKDNGTTWIALPADTLVEVQPDELPANGRVKVRSTNTITELDHDALSFRTRLFKSINIRNGKSLTTLSETFRLSKIDNIRIINIPDVASLYCTFAYGVFNNVYIPHAPAVTDMGYMTYYASILAFGGIVAQNATDARSAFSYLKNNNYMGDIELGTGGVIVYHMFGQAKVKILPTIKFGYAITIPNSNGSYTFNTYSPIRMFLGCTAPYILYGQIDTKTSSYVNAGDIMESSGFYFSGLDISDYWSYVNYQDGMFNNCPNLIYPFSRFEKPHGAKGIINMFTDSPNITTDITEQEHIDLETDGTHTIVELPNWLPDFIQIETNDVLDILGVVSSGAIGFIIHSYTQDGADIGEHISTRVSNYDSALYDSSIDTVHDSSQMYIAKNGYRAVQTAAGLSVYDETGTIVINLADVLSTAGNLNSDATKLLIVTGGSIDPLTIDGQVVVQTVTEYDVATGAVLRTLNFTNENNTEIVGVYKSSDDSNMHIVKTTWGLATEYSVELIMDTSLVSTYNNEYVYIKDTNLTDPVNLVTNHHVEDSEFNCLNTVTGKHLRCFGK